MLAHCPAGLLCGHMQAERERLDVRIWGTVLGTAVGKTLGLGLMIPGIVGGLSYWGLTRQEPRNPYAAAISLFWGHSTWMLFGSVVTRTTNVLWDIAIMTVGSLWLLLRPSRRIGLALITYALLCLTLNLMRLFTEDESSRKALITHCMLNAGALWALMGVVWKSPPQPAAEPESAPTQINGSRVMRRIGIALGVLWALGCLLASLGGYSSNRTHDVAWGLTFGALPWGVWWVLRGFDNWRRAVGGIVLVLVLIGLGVYGTIQALEHRNELKRRVSYDRIKIGEVEMVEARLSTAKSQYLPMTARVRNRNTQFTLEGLEVDVLVYDCPIEDAPPDLCDLVANPHEYVEITIPPLQSRDIAHTIRMPEQYTIRGYMQWNARLARIRAQMEDD